MQTKSGSLGAQTKQKLLEMVVGGAVLNCFTNTLREGFQRKKDVSHDMMRKGSYFYTKLL